MGPEMEDESSQDVCYDSDWSEPGTLLPANQDRNLIQQIRRRELSGFIKDVQAQWGRIGVVTLARGRSLFDRRKLFGQSHLHMSNFSIGVALKEMQREILRAL